MSDSPTPTETAPSPSSSGGLKDTFESILIALILAFVFRAFIVEAFVIPTGSMAPTLLGAHMRLKCDDCGYDFTTNYSAPAIPGTDDLAIPREAIVNVGRRTPDGRVVAESQPYTFNLTCPNCGFRVPRFDRENPGNDATAQPVHYGDRILVLKYAYLGTEPQRWDVTVFKSPFDQGGRPPSQPDFQQNYIKRLVGLPGEQLMVLDGDVFVRPPPASGSEGDASGDGWTVQTKPRHVQQVLWRVVADNDYQPRGLTRAPMPDYQSPWKPLPGGPVPEFAADRRHILLNAQEGVTSGVSFDPSANARRFPLTDWLAFNTTSPQQQRTQDTGNPDQFDFVERTPDNAVSDLHLRLSVARDSGSGPVTLTLTKLGHAFRARLTPGEAALLHTRPDGSSQVIGTVSLSSRGPLEVEFENVDYRVALRINGREVLATTPEQYAPDVAGLLAAYKSERPLPRPEVRIEATGAAARVSHLALYRDVYYTNRPPMGTRDGIRWGYPGNPITLGKGEFFVLGDNSQLSFDSRFWSTSVDLRMYEDLWADAGRVPERFMLGKAFFVYWPAGHRPGSRLPGIVPNFGEMRMIH